MLTPSCLAATPYLPLPTALFGAEEQGPVCASKCRMLTLRSLRQLLGTERLSAVLGRLQSCWESGGDSGWSEELLLVLGREQLHLLPLLVQAVQLRRAADRPAASPGHSRH